jgi:outer membrane receptor protein involved in Fe transport
VPISRRTQLTFERSVAVAVLVMGLAPGLHAPRADDALERFLSDGPDSTEPEADRTLPEPEPSPSGRQVIESIVVTAQKKEQDRLDVPVSLSVLDGDFIRSQGMTSLTDLNAFSPNTNLKENPGSADIRIRGFGTGPTNRAFEQSVGLLYDGIPYNQLGYFAAHPFDLERIEILRGPQGTLHGKNTIAGLVQVIRERRATNGRGISTSSSALSSGAASRRRSVARSHRTS